jgi:uncharacterized protein YodC (DUF2158 family)
VSRTTIFETILEAAIGVVVSMLMDLFLTPATKRNRAILIHARQYRESYSAMARPYHSKTQTFGFYHADVDETGCARNCSDALVAVSTSWAVPALAGPAQSSITTQSRSVPLLQSGDLVRLRSGGPVLTVKSVRDGWVICSWFGDYGELESGCFPIAMVEGPVTPPNDTNPQTDGLSAE